MQALKALVILMGILILAGTTVVVVTIANRLGGGGDAEEQVPGPEAAARPAGFGAADLPVPEGCRVVSLTAAGERLLLRLGSGGRCEQILVVDMGTGSLLGRFTMTPAQE